MEVGRWQVFRARVCRGTRVWRARDTARDLLYGKAARRNGESPPARQAQCAVLSYTHVLKRQVGTLEALLWGYSSAITGLSLVLRHPETDRRSLSGPGHKHGHAPRALRRPPRKARGGSIPAVFDRRGTQRGGMHRRPNATVLMTGATSHRHRSRWPLRDRAAFAPLCRSPLCRCRTVVIEPTIGLTCEEHVLWLITCQR